MSLDQTEDQQSVMIALLPVASDWCQIKLPHMTLVYAGEISALQPGDHNELAKDAASLSMLVSPLYCRVTGRETFGKGDNNDPMMDVFTLLPTPDLWAMRRYVEKWNASEFPFQPHCTIGPVGTPVDMAPDFIAFDRIMVGWGSDYMTFWLKR